MIDEPVDSLFQDSLSEVLVVLDASAARGRSFDPRSCADQERRADPPGMARREGEADPGPHRVADQVNPKLLQLVQHGDQILEAARHAVVVWRRRRIGAAVTNQIDEDAPAILSQSLGDATHRLCGSGKAMQDQDRLASPSPRLGHLHVQEPACPHLDAMMGRRAHGDPPLPTEWQIS